jgi:clan AA aspartic protease (TIGR02281 family)
VQPGGYIVSFEELSIFGNIEYKYDITMLEPTAAGYLEGTWQYRFVGQADWSIPQNFSAVRQEVVIPLDPSCNCYLVNGTVNGYATPFLVDTGAFAVLLDLADASHMGLVDEETGGLNSRCDQTPVQLGGVGGTITAYKCYADIEIEGRLSRQNVEVYLSEGQSALLGMTFLDQFHISTNAEDGTMIIAP